MLLSVVAALTSLATCRSSGSDDGSGGGTGGCVESTGGGTGGACVGDAAMWASFTTAPIPCTSDLDCCVVYNDCLGETQVVSADDAPLAEDAWPYCVQGCNLCCSAPAVAVGCILGECAGIPLDPYDFPYFALDANHCGNGGVWVPLVPGALHFACSGG